MNFLSYREILVWFLIAMFGVYAVWPVTYWYEPGEIYVADFYQYQIPEVKSSRIIKRDFTGSYSVSVRNSGGESVVSPVLSGDIPYKKNGQLPLYMDLEYWAANVYDQIIELTPGNYVMQTCWRIHRKPETVLSPKVICRDSNVFTIKSNDSLH